MSRFFNGRLVELLAPVGNFEIFKEIIHSGADAVYFGGKALNMRLHRKEFNFSNEEIVQAVNIAHSLNKKVYVTLNNILNEDEVEEAKEFITFLSTAKVDAVIASDMAIVQLVNDLKLDLEIHSSVMMNVHNSDMINILKNLGVTRIVASRNMELDSVKKLFIKTGMEIEYFTHGDLCFMHDSQCLYSGILFGMSSNRGRCLMPCRWGYDVKKGDKIYPNTFPLSSKDMYMYEHIPELIEAGVSSFKIEGRMRDAAYLLKIINAYSESIDRYLNDPINYDRKVKADFLYENRHRDLTTGFSFGNPGLDFSNNRNTVNGKNFATKKFFSFPVEEREIEEEKIIQVKEVLSVEDKKTNELKLCVRVSSFEQAKVAIEEGANRIYLAGEVFEPKKPFSRKEISELNKIKGNTEIFLALPRMTLDNVLNQYAHYLNSDLDVDGVLATNLGSIARLKNSKIKIIGDTNLNIYNSTSLKFYVDKGIEEATLSMELKSEELIRVVKDSKLPLEMVVHGSPTVLYMEHDLYQNIIDKNSKKANPNTGLHKDALFIVDENNFEHPVYRDQYGRNHMLMYKDLCLLPVLKELADVGIKNFRIEGVHLSVKDLKNVISVYKKSLEDLNNCNEYLKDLTYREEGFTLGALHFIK